MAFPTDRLAIRVRLAFGADPTGDPADWIWSDASGDLLNQTAAISRGSANYAAQAQPSSGALQLDNAFGDYTPDYPLGANYPDVILGVPCDISAQGTETFLLLPGAVGDRASTPDDPGLDITGDLDLRLEATLAPWFIPDASGAIDLVGRWDAVTPLLGYRLIVNTAGGLSLSWSDDGTLAGFTFADGLTPVPVPPSGRITVRATLDTDNGAGGWTVTFYTADTIAGPWTQLGDAVTDTGTTSITNVALPLEVGDLSGTIAAIFHPPRGRIHALQVRDGIDGTITANPDFTAQTADATTFTDSAGRTWTLDGNSEITDWYPRLTGTVDDWAPTWPYGDLSDDDTGDDGEARVDITVSGILRRLDQGDKALQSTLRRRIPTFGPLAYWPMEDGTDSTQLASALDGGTPMTATGLTYASDGTLAGSSALPAWGEDAEGGGTVPAGDDGAWQIEFVYQLDEMPASLETLLEITTTGTATLYTVRLQTNNIQVKAFDSGGTQLMFINSTAPDFTGSWSRFQLWAQQNGSDVDIHLAWITIGGSGLAVDDSFTGTEGHITGITVRGVPGSLRLGHLSAFDSIPASTVYNSADQAFAGERAGARIARLCAEENISLTMLGVPSGTERMGPQRPATLLTLLGEAATIDGGVLGEQLDRPGLHYRTRTSLYNQPVALPLDAALNEIDNPFAPVLNDQGIRNDIELSRTGGSSATAADSDSIARHGRYDAQPAVNAYTDAQLPDLVNWLLHLGTWPGMRYPSVTVDLATAPQLIDDWLTTYPGDRITIVNLPPQHPTDTVDLFIDGYAERLSPTGWTVTANCSKGGPWNVAAVDAGFAASSDGSELADAIDASQTTISIAVTAGTLWATDPAEPDTDIVIGGERMTITDITGETSPQSATVVRGVNGIVKTHLAGAPIALALPPIVPL